MASPSALHAAPRPHPVELASLEPAAIAQATLEGFNRHYAIFRDCARAAKSQFEAGNWLAIARKPPIRVSVSRRKAIVAPKAKAREPHRAATHTEGLNHSLTNSDPSNDHSPGRGQPR